VWRITGNNRFDSAQKDPLCRTYSTVPQGGRVGIHEEDLQVCVTDNQYRARDQKNCGIHRGPQDLHKYADPSLCGSCRKWAMEKAFAKVPLERENQ
jgi:hypothetical protein